ncbi:MAG: hypothetical protein RLZZ265_783 [Verrucomicrobiota bacterium]
MPVTELPGTKRVNLKTTVENTAVQQQPPEASPNQADTAALSQDFSPQPQPASA